MRFIQTAIGVVIFLALAALAFSYAGLYDVRASSAHSAPVRWLLSTTSDASIRRQASSIEVPALTSERLIHAGINDYQAMCAGCHGVPGEPPTPLAQGLNPQAPDLSVSARSMSSAELFWVTKHGIKMTGMPAWGVSHDDASLWPVVAFMTRLPDLNARDYQALLVKAKGAGHHDNPSNQDTPDHSEPDSSHDSHEHPLTVHDEDAPGAPVAKDKANAEGHHDDHDHDH